MKRPALGFITGLLAVALIAATVPTGVDAFLEDIDVRVSDLEARVSVLEEPSDTTTTTTITPTSTSTVGSTTTAPTSTSSSNPATTTTVASTTTIAPTTTVPSTTTTLSSTELPETLAYPSSGIKAGEGFFFMISCKSSGSVDCNPDGSNAGIGVLTYMGHGMPYLYSDAVEGNHDHGWWVAGDREAYKCAYAFLYDRHPNPFGGEIVRDGELIARATIVRPFGQSYGAVNDKYMSEATRWYDGTLYTGEGSKEIPEEDCQETALDDFDYENYTPHGPDDIRVGLFADNEVSDIRDFTDFVWKDTSGHFEFVGFDGDRATIVHILDGDVSHVFYYDVMGSGRVVVEVNGELVGG